MDKNNYCIIMAGGPGTRLWPISRTGYPKQFLEVGKTGQSFIRRTYDRFAKFIPAENIIIVTAAKYRDIVREQIPELAEDNLLLEPYSRNTAPCIAYATYKIRETNAEANIIVVPSDHLITNETEYVRVVKEGLRFVSLNDSILTLGMKPTRPETGYGYIQIGTGGGELRKVKTFTEKPNAEMAKIFYESGEFYWNSGMFLWRADVVVKAFESLLPDVAEKFEAGREYYNTEREQAFIDRIYPLCPNISIDYGIMEKASNVYVMMSDFGWSDLGTWSSLYDLSAKDGDGNAVLKCNAGLYGCQNNIIALPKGKLAVIDGLEGYLVAEEGDVLLICKKDDEAKIRQFVKDAGERYGDKYI